jgi:hypothetical protein
MNLDINKIRRVSTDYRRDHPPSEPETIETLTSRYIATIARGIEEAAARGENSYTNAIYMMVDDYKKIYETGRSRDELPKGFFGGCKMPADFWTNPRYLNNINKKIVEHFTSLGFSVSLAPAIFSGVMVISW